MTNNTQIHFGDDPFRAKQDHIQRHRWKYNKVHLSNAEIVYLSLLIFKISNFYSKILFIDKKKHFKS